MPEKQKRCPVVLEFKQIFAQSLVIYYIVQIAIYIIDLYFYSPKFLSQKQTKNGLRLGSNIVDATTS